MTPIALLAVLGMVYTAVLMTELIGDRSIYTIGSLAARFGAAPVMGGISIAFAAKMLAAVLLGHTLALLPQAVVRTVAVLALLGAACAIWREARGGREEVRAARAGHPLLVSFAAVFFMEWADPGQLAAAMLSVRYPPALVWSAATAALVTKGALAIALGLTVRRWVPAAFLRNLTIGTLLCLAVLVATGVAD